MRIQGWLRGPAGRREPKKRVLATVHQGLVLRGRMDRTEVNGAYGYRRAGIRHEIVHRVCESGLGHSCRVQGPGVRIRRLPPGGGVWRVRTAGLSRKRRAWSYSRVPVLRGRMFVARVLALRVPS